MKKISVAAVGVLVLLSGCSDSEETNADSSAVESSERADQILCEILNQVELTFEGGEISGGFTDSERATVEELMALGDAIRPSRMWAIMKDGGLFAPDTEAYWLTYEEAVALDGYFLQNEDLSC